MSASFCVVLSCAGRGLALEWSPRPRSPTKCLMDPRNWNRILGWRGTVEALCSVRSERGINNNNNNNNVMKWLNCYDSLMNIYFRWKKRVLSKVSGVIPSSYLKCTEIMKFLHHLLQFLVLEPLNRHLEVHALQERKSELLSFIVTVRS
jgi:hypothetical protein